jgi:hypothetical protein
MQHRGILAPSSFECKLVGEQTIYFVYKCSE